MALSRLRLLTLIPLSVRVPVRIRVSAQVVPPMDWGNLPVPLNHQRLKRCREDGRGSIEHLLEERSRRSSRASNRRPLDDFLSVDVGSIDDQDPIHVRNRCTPVEPLVEEKSCSIRSDQIQLTRGCATFASFIMSDDFWFDFRRCWFWNFCWGCCCQSWR